VKIVLTSVARTANLACYGKRNKENRDKNDENHARGIGRIFYVRHVHDLGDDLDRG
jgi:hypothetical protein